MTDIIRDPQAIEQKSFEIIDAEVGEHCFSEQEWPIVRRIVHTTADFDFVANTLITDGAVAAALTVLQQGCAIYCDTNMVLSGVNKSRLTAFGCSISCHVGDTDVAEQAKAEGVTRSIVALRKGVAEGCRIFLIGNAPTALYELLQLCRDGKVEPALIVGAPVGFVGAAESKEELVASGLSQITCRGRKGGSAIAAAICNALLLLAEKGN
ncbi:MAG: precorrin-8X methylmutase [Desulfuromonas sp.]|nr:MAG: precorrin-8X methylmutase [Desulfuromonas sp.]